MMHLMSVENVFCGNLAILHNRSFSMKRAAHIISSPPSLHRLNPLPKLLSCLLNAHAVP